MALTVKVINPDEILFEGEAEYVLAPGKRGTLGILSGHTSMFAELVGGELFLKGETEKLLAIEGGVLKVRGDEVIILVTNQTPAIDKGNATPV